MSGEFWQFFAVFMVGLLNGMVVGRASATTALILKQQQQAQQQIPPQLMEQLMGRHNPMMQPPGNGPAA